MNTTQQVAEEEAGGGAGGERVGAGAELDVEIRPLAGQSEYAACVRLQYETWGAGYRDAVPVSLLKVSQKVGGLVAGAFLGTGELVGFVFGLSGLEGGRGVHWSHMLAVSRVHRDRGVGRRLKLYQREYLGEVGVLRMLWSFDPLVARNAHLNVNRLGVRLLEYVPDMYEGTGSDLHTFGTDRFVAEWEVAGGPVVEPVRADETVRTAPVVNVRGQVEGDAVAGGAERVRIEIPLDAETMAATSPVQVRRWRLSTRESFLTLLGRGYGVMGFYREDGRCYWVLRGAAG